jgi:hypothetical protein
MTRERDTLHEIAAQSLLKRFMETEVGRKNLAEGERWLREGRKDDGKDYLDCIGQYHWRDPGATDLAQLASCVTVHHRLMNPYMTAQVDIGIGEKPGPDARRRENDAALADLPEPFAAVVPEYQHDTSQGDGILRWSGPIKAFTSTGVPLIDLHAGTCRQKNPIVWKMLTLPAGQVPLEIGFTRASKTLHHLLLDGGIARWAYGQKVVRVWVTLIRPAIDL